MLDCGGSNTNKTVCNSLLELMTVSAQSVFNSRGFDNSMQADHSSVAWDHACARVLGISCVLPMLMYSTNICVSVPMLSHTLIKRSFDHLFVLPVCLKNMARSGS
ncbi:hypothetical protein CAPTEDRAFT_214491 [Capitella teleta]|uniref:Uncharacterized protein n=1 Tax=Capitella teleta TaxID=283909 RepID=R7UYL0_CAPTE|nr:hypothetical protein CAPTEDRAFT_214491 [Capitella teleta]|eukprot:ELU11648.1 hypothetical protein CAPTEDRAFT_214491 [Capitella teleta]